MIDPEKDGIDHINIYSKGKTELGKFLTNFAHTPFEHPEDGKFESVEGYWYWLSCKNDDLRHVYGFQAKKLGRELGGKDWVEGTGFQYKIKLAILAKFNANPDAFIDLIDSELPFKHYYVFGGKVIEPKEGQWLLDFFESMRSDIPLIANEIDI